jgi:hypothetical protein
VEESILLARKLTMVAAIATSLAFTGGLGVANAEVASPASPASCGWHPANNDNQPGQFTADGVNIRNGDDTSCAALGLGYTSHSVTIHCQTRSWVYITDNTTGVTGWSSIQFLTWGVGGAYC